MANDAHAKKPIVIERRREKGRRKSPRLTKTYEVMVIVTREAEVIRTIFTSFIKGMHPTEIAEKLNALGIRTVKNNL